MQRSFNPFKQLERMSSFDYTGRLIITSHNITWKIDLEKSQLKSASHCLQGLDTLELCLSALGYGERIPKIIEKMSQDGLNLEKGDKFIQESVEWLIRKERFSFSQQVQLINQLTQNALDSFFSITTVDHYICEEKSYFFPLQQGFDVQPLLKTWQDKHKVWKQFYPVIISPHQRPYCPKREELNQLSASKSKDLLMKIAYQKSKLSIRQIGTLLNLEDWKVAELIYPHLQSGILQLYSPLAPFNQLPPFRLDHNSSEDNQPSNQIAQTQGISNNEKYKKIVCIDDNDITLKTIKSHLPPEDTNLYLVSDPKLALNQLFEIQPDLLLVDINTSGINGYQFSKIIKASSLFKQLPIIMMSSDRQKIEEVKSKEKIANDFLPKPCSQTELMTVINKYL